VGRKFLITMVRGTNLSFSGHATWLCGMNVEGLADIQTKGNENNDVEAKAMEAAQEEATHSFPSFFTEIWKRDINLTDGGSKGTVARVLIIHYFNSFTEPS
jgi:hypothetical protein